MSGSSAPNASLFQQPIELTASVGLTSSNCCGTAPAAIPATGTVDFQAEGFGDLSPSSVPVVGGTATFTFDSPTAPLPASQSGEWWIDANYSGDYGTYGTYSNIAGHHDVLQEVDPDPTVVGVSASPTVSAYGDTVTLSAQVTVAPQPFPTPMFPSGEVQFFDGNTAIGKPIGVSGGNIVTLTIPTYRKS